MRIRTTTNTLSAARAVSAVAASALLLTLASCSSDDRSAAAISVDNCGDTVTFDAPPENVTILKSAPVTTLSTLGVLDRVKNRAGLYPPEYFSDETNAALDTIPSITDQTDESGHLQISREEVVATAPDLVIGETDTINRQTMASSGIPVIEEPAFCGSIEGDVTWDDVWDQITVYGTIFGKEEEAATYIDELQQRLDAVTDAPTATKPDGSPYSIAVLYPTIGGGVTYAYGTGSMAAPIVASAGAENTYGDQTDRVFEVSAEDIVDRNPDVILALYSDGREDQIVDAVNRLPGIDRTTAGKNQQILPMLLNFAEPPTPLGVDGLEKLDAYLRGLD